MARQSLKGQVNLEYQRLRSILDLLKIACKGTPDMDLIQSFVQMLGIEVDALGRLCGSEDADTMP